MSYPHADRSPYYTVGFYDEGVKDWYLGFQSRELDWAMAAAPKIAVKYQAKVRVSEVNSGNQIALFDSDGKRIY